MDYGGIINLFSNMNPINHDFTNNFHLISRNIHLKSLKIFLFIFLVGKYDLIKKKKNVYNKILI